MIQTGLIEHAHEDLITDTAYDFYGLRLATCGLDQRIKIWLLNESTGKWLLEDEWKAHDAPVSRLSWAHPEFGTILASSSFDRTVKVWEQVAPLRHAEASTNGTGNSSQSQQPLSNSRWVERTVLTDARGTVRAVEFAPRHFGLKLATIATDNYLRVYECVEQPSLSTWQLSDEFDVQRLHSPASHSSPSRTHTATLSTPTQIGATFDSASASLVSQALQQNVAASSPSAHFGTGNREADGGWCISWCKDRYWGETIAAGCGTNGIIKIIQLSPSHRPICILSLNPAPPPPGPKAAPPPPSADRTTTPPPPPPQASADVIPLTPTTVEPSPPVFAVTTVSWAPSCGRSYHLVATGGRDGRVRIWRVKPGEDLEHEEEEDEGGKWTANLVADFSEHKSAVGRVEWNVTGTVLSSAGNDGRIRLWKASFGGVWRPAGSVGVDQVGEDEPQENKDLDMES